MLASNITMTVAIPTNGYLKLLNSFNIRNFESLNLLDTPRVSTSQLEFGDNFTTTLTLETVRYK